MEKDVWFFKEGKAAFCLSRCTIIALLWANWQDSVVRLDFACKTCIIVREEDARTGGMGEIA